MSNPSSDSYRNPLRYQGQDYSFAPRYYRPRDPLPPQNASTDIKPKENQGYYPLASFWSNSHNGNLWVLTEIVNNLANWILIGTSKGSLLSLSDNVNTVVFPSPSGATPPDNIQFTGNLNQQSGSIPSPFQTIVANPSNYSININPMSPARWIVDQLGQNGTHTAIQSAIDSASSGDTILILPGIYVENIVLKAGVNLCAFTCDTYTPNVTITGNITFSDSGLVSISGILMNGNGVVSTSTLSISGSNNSVVNCINCYIISNYIGVLNSSPNSTINLYNCIGDQSVTSVTFFVNGTGFMNFFNCTINNSGEIAFPSPVTEGFCNIFYSTFNSAIATGGTSTFGIFYSTINTSALNTTCLSIHGSDAQVVKYCDFVSGSEPAITILSPATANVHHCNFDSTSTYAIDGAGTIDSPDASFTNTSFAVNPTLSIVPQFFGLSGSWTPNLQINGSSTGITYSIQNGNYILLGKICYFAFTITLTNKGANSGNLTISNLPFTVNSSFVQHAVVSLYSYVTITNMSTLGLQFTSGTIATFDVSFNSGVAGRIMTDADIANNTMLEVSGFYVTA